MFNADEIAKKYGFPNASNPAYKHFLKNKIQEFKCGGKMKEYAEGGEIKEYKNGGVIYVDNPNDPRLQSYQDSLNIYNNAEKSYQKIINTAKSQDNTLSKIDLKSNKSIPYTEYINEYEGGKPKFGVINSGTNKYMYPQSINRFKGEGIFGALNYVAQARFKKPTQPVEFKKPKLIVTTPLKDIPQEPNLNTDLVAYLQSQKVPFDYAHRKELAKQYGIENYKGTAEQNIKLLNLVKQGETNLTENEKSLLPKEETTPQTKQEPIIEKQTKLTGEYLKVPTPQGNTNIYQQLPNGQRQYVGFLEKGVTDINKIQKFAEGGRAVQNIVVTPMGHKKVYIEGKYVGYIPKDGNQIINSEPNPQPKFPQIEQIKGNFIKPQETNNIIADNNMAEGGNIKVINPFIQIMQKGGYYK